MLRLGSRGIAAFSMLLAGGLMFLLARLPSNHRLGGARNDDRELFVYCAASIQPALAAIAEEFEREPFGLPIRLQYGGSGTLLNNLQISQTGDLYVAADQSFMDLAIGKGVVTKSVPIARMRPVIAVAKGNPKGIRSIQDLLREDVRVGLANPEAASIGKLARDILQQQGQWDRLQRKVAVFKPTVSDVANDVILGALDAAIVWDVVALQNKAGMSFVRQPCFEEAVQQVTIGVTSFSRQPAAAWQFVRYVQAPHQGQRFLRRLQFETLDLEAADLEDN